MSNKKIPQKKFKNLSWDKWIERPYSPFMASLTFDKMGKDSFQKVGLGDFGYPANLYQYPFLYQSKKLSEINKRVSDRYFKKNSVFDMINLLSSIHKKNKINIKKIKKDTNFISNLLEIEKMLGHYIPFLWCLDIVETYYNEKIEKEVKKYIKNDIDRWVGDVSMPNKKNAHVLMQEDLLKKPIEEVHKKYAWMKSRDGFSDFYTINELKEIKKQTIKNKIKKGGKEQHIIPKELIKLVEELRGVVFFRTDRTDKYYEFLGLCRPTFKRIAKELNISFNDLSFYSIKSIIDRRPKKYKIPFSFAYLEGYKPAMVEGIFMNFKKESQKEIKGSVAFAGKKRGIVQIIKHSSDLKNFKEGNILVTQMTFPSFISAMNKSIAFVTDEGGITCHAAIVSREMKKPCIIGTKIATQVLKDGDLVEVDANNGVVKILKRAK